MFTYAGLALALLQVINNLMSYVGRRQAMKAGTDAEIAKLAQEILAKTAVGKAIMEKVDALAEKDVDAALRELEPK